MSAKHFAAQLTNKSCHFELARNPLNVPLSLSFTLLSGKLNIPSLSESGFTGFQDFQDYELVKPPHLHH